MNVLEHRALSRIQELMKQARAELAEAEKHPQGQEAENTKRADRCLGDAGVWLSAVLDNMVERSYDGG